MRMAVESLHTENASGEAALGREAEKTCGINHAGEHKQRGAFCVIMV